MARKTELKTHHSILLSGDIRALCGTNKAGGRLETAPSKVSCAKCKAYQKKNEAWYRREAKAVLAELKKRASKK